MSSLATAPQVTSAVACEATQGLTATPKTLSPWLFYDEEGSHLFEQITTLPEYYLTRTERGIFATHADEIIARAAGRQRLTLVELGAGTATKTGLLLAAAVRRQASVVYQPVDVSETALDEARENIETNIPGVTVHSQIADYTSEPLSLKHRPGTRTLALYIGSSIGNFAPQDAHDVLRNLRTQLKPGDSLLLGTDLAKDEATLLAAYNDAAGVTAAFNRNVLTRLNRELGANFRVEKFAHKAIWNARESRIEMHLCSTVAQSVNIPASADCPALTLDFAAGETIHTENSYKFTKATISALLGAAGFTLTQTWHDADKLFAVTLAEAI
jgi:L-histidine N-alpha-methyltransferase